MKEANAMIDFDNKAEVAKCLRIRAIKSEPEMIPVFVGDIVSFYLFNQTVPFVGRVTDIKHDTLCVDGSKKYCSITCEALIKAIESIIIIKEF